MAYAAVYVQLDIDAVRQILRGPGGEVMQDLIRRGTRVQNEARKRCPVDTGRLRGSIVLQQGRVGGVPAVRIGTNLPYGLYVHEGTGIYVGRGRIRPRTKSVLRWPKTNRTGSGRRRYRQGATEKYIYARSVRGMPGRPFLTQALARAAD